MKLLFTILLVLPGLTGLPVFADLSHAVYEDIANADLKPEEEEPDCE